MTPIYDPESVRPMWEELDAVGIRPLRTPEAVDEHLGSEPEGTTLLVVNSVCGCAAGSCRPGVALALQNQRIPDNLVTVFAGVDVEATARARSYMPGITPSSPNIVLFKNGTPSYCLQRHHIEVLTAVDVANSLVNMFNQHCSARGPSVPKEVFKQNEAVQTCGSSVPLYRGE